MKYIDIVNDSRTSDVSKAFAKKYGSEKKAISDPDINAEHISNTSINAAAITTLKVKGFNRTLANIQSAHK